MERRKDSLILNKIGKGEKAGPIVRDAVVRLWMAGISWQCSWAGGLVWSPDAFTFQWELAVVQVSN